MTNFNYMRTVFKILLFCFIVLFAIPMAKAGNVVRISGFVLDAMTGTRITSGNVTAIVKETGDTNTTVITNGRFNFDLNSSLNIWNNKYIIGLFINSSENKIGYASLTSGFGNYAQQTQSCSIKQWRFTGWVVDSEGVRISSGNVSVSVNNGTLVRNTTAFTNGKWGIVFSPCLISGQTYDFQILLTTADKRAYTFIRQVAK